MNKPYVVDLWVEFNSPGSGKCRKTVKASDWEYFEIEGTEQCEFELLDLLSAIDAHVKKKRTGS